MRRVHPALSLESPLLRRLTPRIAEFGNEWIDAALAPFPGTEQLPAQHFHRLVIPAITSGWTALLRAIDEARPLVRADIEASVAGVVEPIAVERVGLGPFITALFTGSKALWGTVAAEAEPQDHDELAALGDLLLQLLEHTTVAAIDAHGEVTRSVYGGERESRRELCFALLNGMPNLEAAAARANVALAPHYDIVAMRCDGNRTAATLVDNALVGRRIRLAQRALDSISGELTMSTFDGTFGTALIPSMEAVEARLRYDDLSFELAEEFGVRVQLVVLPSVEVPAIPSAANESAELCEIAHRVGRPTGTYDVDDLMLEYQLSRPGIARDRMLARIAPLQEHPHLLAALRAHLEYGSDRKRAAAQMHLHPNTLSYRLKRAASLTGLDPGDPADSRLLAASLLLHRIQDER